MASLLVQFLLDSPFVFEYMVRNRVSVFIGYETNRPISLWQKCFQPPFSARKSFGINCPVLAKTTFATGCYAPKGLRHVAGGRAKRRPRNGQYRVGQALKGRRQFPRVKATVAPFGAGEILLLVRHLKSPLRLSHRN
jgi:hypothetical protein